MWKFRLMTGFAGILALAACATEDQTAMDNALLTEESTVVQGGCIAATMETTGAVMATVSKTEFTSTGTVVYLDIPGAEAPWACYVNDAGTVERVEYTGSEGYL